MAKQTQPADFYVSFGGNHGQSNVDEPKLGQQVEYTVFGTVSKVSEAIRDDGETRLTISVDVDAAWPKGSKRPDAANQGTLVTHEGKAETSMPGEPEHEGVPATESTLAKPPAAAANVVNFSDSKGEDKPPATKAK